MASEIRDRLPDRLQRCTDLAKEKGASSWLEAIPIREQGFYLSRTEFRDAVALRFGWRPENLPSHCACGADFDTAHALSCPTGGLPSIRHNEIRDLVAFTLSEVCHDVVTEPYLHRTTASASGIDAPRTDMRLDIKARGFWGGRMEEAMFDVRVFNPFAASAVTTSIQQLYHQHEAEKRRKYECLLREENCAFTPLILSTSGSVSPLTSTFLKRLASKLLDKKNMPYSQTLCWLWMKLAFSILRSGSMCLRASRRKFYHHGSTEIEPAVALTSAGLT